MLKVRVNLKQSEGVKSSDTQTDIQQHFGWERRINNTYPNRYNRSTGNDNYDNKNKDDNNNDDNNINIFGLHNGINCSTLWSILIN